MKIQLPLKYLSCNDLHTLYYISTPSNVSKKYKLTLLGRWILYLTFKCNIFIFENFSEFALSNNLKFSGLFATSEMIYSLRLKGLIQ